ncbi:MAG: pyrroline-5-carboxylate reductase [Candidatus Melainabacteria bacterium GWF2_32_7]|nr:MAG: pyrroline-5-carboxylate reductase [Candidatus Melainabacteria bacterium GWF2_32_7]OGI22899.1 MAG: pyrroline-5-carboxylate reductase [Candidatus Melainabacteria bacterium RIFOXYA2_FULL_32_9]
MLENIKIGFIGAGVMGKAIISGLIKSKFVPENNLTASEITEEIAKKVSGELGIEVISNNKDLIKTSDVIILSTKPFIIKNVLEEIKEDLTKEKIIISIAAGISTDFIENILEKEVPVVRIMPNTPAVVGEGMSAISRGKYVTDNQIELVKRIFSNIGRCIEVQEKYMNAVTGISGSGPAFIYLIIEALADGGVKLGLPKKIAIELAAQTALGAAKMVLETEKHPSVLKDEVTTPGGCTIAGLAVMEDSKIRAALSKTVQETAKVASELSSK